MRPATRASLFALPLLFAAELALAQTPPSVEPSTPPPAPNAAAATNAPPPPPADANAPQLHGTAWTATTPTTRRSSVRARLRLLDQALIPMAERSRDARVPGAVTGLIAGGLILGIGAFTYEPASHSNAASTYLMILGGAEIASGIVQLAWAPARERITAQYRAMPRRTAAERRAQLRFGEQAFDDIAADGARRRVLNSLFNVGISLSLLGVIYAPQLFDGAPWPEPPAANYLVIGLTGVAVVSGLVGLFTRSEEERMRDVWRSQQELLDEPAATN